MLSTMYFYGPADHYTDDTNYPVLVRLDIGRTPHGMMRLAMRHHGHEYKLQYKEIKTYKKVLALKQTSWAISEFEYYHLLATRWVPMTERFVRTWGKERTPVPLRQEISNVRQCLRLEAVRWPSIPIIDKFGNLRELEDTNEVGVVVESED